ncbi:Gfo/Idh/MocA family oxidoreductase [Francisella philomiragia]|uniref:Dehydrogenase n=1 Tax=Francisella philomiragia subsp. philomiragia (strain ATCC 25017 / CCUG 19701 / FSC 153 / O\|nr:Gfo/Idh/MocA family oxidoreductase [Francisella philomiragia]AJI46573.1 oxidoreductase, NAD-binding Rossmann fold family protein [Francisella philomiragia]AJI49610.1 oxidoreductase, NAD-binding Rossmann fold family protein [Francisella philomiragia]MBK2019705.1 Gfo/Idh/MocA family oxidoreductase [Francisella philomiragia]MBK2029510.1 Gfo/Idh/MocA family oxidoreductase [Francisella philomiragia]MBK2264036.1 Gfo/Idh/MocA family oxidoreductase [Francisella philomiragia]
MKKIAIIGAGQLGSRHLQGVVSSSHNYDIQIVDLNNESLKVAEERYLQVKPKSSLSVLSTYSSIDELSDEIDTVIIATNSNVRFKVLKELLEKKSIKNLVIEKVLFQNLEEYDQAEELILKHGVKAWVNHPRRMYPFYKKLKKELQNKELSFTYVGGNWGLGCNGLHFLDCFSYLSSSECTNIYSNLLDEEVYDSKRSNFKEFSGAITGKLNGSKFYISCLPETSAGFMTISGENISVQIDEVAGWCRIKKMVDNKWLIEECNEKIVYTQSELTTLLLDDIEKDKCNLPGYEESMRLHKQFLKVFLDHLNSQSDTYVKCCPIT